MNRKQIFLMKITLGIIKKIMEREAPEARPLDAVGNSSRLPDIHAGLFFGLSMGVARFQEGSGTDEISIELPDGLII